MIVRRVSSTAFCFFLCACSGRYEVGSDPSGGRNSGAGLPDGTSAGAGKGGSSFTGASSGGTFGEPLGGASSGGAGSVGAAPGTAGAPEGDGTMGQIGCAIAQPAAVPDSGWAAPSTVYARLSAFVLGSVTPPATSGLPARTTRAWAREIVMQLFDTREDGEAPAGLTRAVAHFHPLAYDAAAAAEHLEWAAPWAAQLAPATAVLGNLFQSPDDGRGRAGVLTDIAALTAKPSISGRGAWLSRVLFCQAFPPPPPDQPEDIDQSMGTRRQALAASVDSNPSCAACHRLLDPPGHSLEHFDEEGAYRATDNGLPIDSSGRLQTGPDLEFTDITDLAPQLAISCEVAHCFTRQVFNDAAAAAGVQPPSELDINRTTKAFVESGLSIRALIRAIAESPSLLR